MGTKCIYQRICNFSLIHHKLSNFSLIHHKLSKTQEIGETHVNSPRCKRWCCHSQLLSKKCHLLMQKNNFQLPYKIFILTPFSFVVIFSFEKDKRFNCNIFAKNSFQFCYKIFVLTAFSFVVRDNTTN